MAYIATQTEKDLIGLLIMSDVEKEAILGIMLGLKAEIINGNYRSAKRFSGRSANIRSRRGSGTILGSNAERTSAYGRNDRLSVRQSGSNTRRYSFESSADKKFK